MKGKTDMDFMYNFEYPEDEKIRVGFLGCGGHSFRNIYPTLQYAPVDLVAVCDVREDRAQAYARQFGARRYYTDYDQMLAEAELDAVIIVTGYRMELGVTHALNAMTAMRAGCHAWIEKPPANSVAEVEEWQAVERETGKFVVVGFKKIFAPAIRRVHEWTHAEAFGPISTIFARHPVHMPDHPGDPRNRRHTRSFLDHIVHPGSILRHIGGPMRAMNFRLDRMGGVIATIEFESGAIGTLFGPGAHLGTAPLERLEVVGEKESVTVDNAVRVIYYRQGGRGDGRYGRTECFLGPDDQAPLFWEPEFSLAQLYNKNLFYEGLVAEILYFCECVKSNTPPTVGGSDYARDLLALYEGFLGEEGAWIELARE